MQLFALTFILTGLVAATNQANEPADCYYGQTRCSEDRMSLFTCNDTHQWDNKGCTNCCKYGTHGYADCYEQSECPDGLLAARDDSVSASTSDDAEIDSVEQNAHVNFHYPCYKNSLKCTRTQMLAKCDGHDWWPVKQCEICIWLPKNSMCLEDWFAEHPDRKPIKGMLEVKDKMKLNTRAETNGDEVSLSDPAGTENADKKPSLDAYTKDVSNISGGPDPCKHSAGQYSCSTERSAIFYCDPDTLTWELQLVCGGDGCCKEDKKKRTFWCGCSASSEVFSSLQTSTLEDRPDWE